MSEQAGLLGDMGGPLEAGRTAVPMPPPDHLRVPFGITAVWLTLEDRVARLDADPVRAPDADGLIHLTTRERAIVRGLLGYAMDRLDKIDREERERDEQRRAERQHGVAGPGSPAGR